MKHTAPLLALLSLLSQPVAAAEKSTKNTITRNPLIIFDAVAFTLHCDHQNMMCTHFDGKNTRHIPCDECHEDNKTINGILITPNIVAVTFFSKEKKLLNTQTFKHICEDKKRGPAFDNHLLNELKAQLDPNPSTHKLQALCVEQAEKKTKASKKQHSSSNGGWGIRYILSRFFICSRT